MSANCLSPLPDFVLGHHLGQTSRAIAHKMKSPVVATAVGKIELSVEALS